MAHGWIGTDLVMVWAIDGYGNPVELQFIQLFPPGLPIIRISIKNGDFHTIITSGFDLLQYRKKGRIDLCSPKQQIHSNFVGHGKLLAVVKLIKICENEEWMKNRKATYSISNVFIAQKILSRIKPVLAKFLKFNEPTNLLHHVNNRTFYSP
jgi:hypothetical protein